MFRMPSPASMTLNLAPMVDVMMCLIIFFLLASSLVTAEHGKVELPWAAAAKEVKGQELGARVTINVRRVRDGTEAAEFIVVDWDGERIVDRLLQPEEMESLLRVRAARATAAGQDLRCLVSADRDVQYQYVETVLRACGLANVRNIVFSVNAGLEPATSGGNG